MYLFILIASLSLIVVFFGLWIYSERNLEGKYSKTISRISFPFPLLALYAIFKLNINFSYILVGLTILSLLVWLVSKRMNVAKLTKEAKSFFYILLFITIFRSFMFEPFQIPSESMLPQLKIGDFLLVNKFSYGLKNPLGNQTFVKTNDPKRGDIVAFVPEHTICNSNISDSYPSNDFDSGQEYLWQRYHQACTPLGLTYVKRVIGEPGDEIIYIDKKFIVNSKNIKSEFKNKDKEDIFFKESFNGTDYLVRNIQDYKNQTKFNSAQKWNVPDGYYFMVGDNRDNSADSRSWGFVPIENIIGRPSIIWMHWECFSCLPSFSRNKILR